MPKWRPREAHAFLAVAKAPGERHSAGGAACRNRTLPSRRVLHWSPNRTPELGSIIQGEKNTARNPKRKTPLAPTSSTPLPRPRSSGDQERHLVVHLAARTRECAQEKPIQVNVEPKKVVVLLCIAWFYTPEPRFVSRPFHALCSQHFNRFNLFNDSVFPPRPVRQTRKAPGQA